MTATASGDEADACPDVAGPANADPTKNGCPLARVEGGQIKITEQVKFAEGSARLLKDSDGVLNAVLELLNKHPEIAKLKIEGYTDNKGQAAFNKTLSGQRAGSVRAWLVLHKVDAARLESAGCMCGPGPSTPTGRTRVARTTGESSSTSTTRPPRRPRRRSRHRQRRSPDSRRASASRSFRPASRSFPARVSGRASLHEERRSRRSGACSASRSFASRIAWSWRAGGSRQVDRSCNSPRLGERPASRSFPVSLRSRGARQVDRSPLASRRGPRQVDRSTLPSR